MQIIYHGLGCFRLQDGNVSVLLDPYEENTGLKIPKQQNDIVVYGNTTVAWRPANKETFLVTEPGEYEVKKVFIYAIPVSANKLIHLIEMEGVILAHLGQVAKAELTAEILHRIEGADILLVPVGNGETLSAKQAGEVVTELEPRVVIPMYYAVPGLKMKLEGIDGFKKEVGGQAEVTEKFKVSRKDLPAEETKLVIIEPTI
ncbi:MAG: MBL fold metallo-hydrolase [Candidatus Komeilibacteria bacterium]|nr:MBL fold metallo-hydrolase [Candidatus Komeilibacteria bacterium]